jgi:PRTRC genetic system ThiF family protein
MKWHYLLKSFTNNHRIEVGLIGCGGTGSHVLTNLAMINEGLKHHGRSELHVTVYDDDLVSESNIGRQTFSEADLGHNKADIMVGRINRFYGYGWEVRPVKWNSVEHRLKDITISAVDKVSPRKQIHDDYIDIDLYEEKYWLDIGNGENDGQIIMSARDGQKILLPTFIDQFGKDIPETPEEPSCSAVESLAKQNLFVNKYMATLATNMLWTLLVNFRIHYRGIFANLSTLETNPILL